MQRITIREIHDIYMNDGARHLNLARPDRSAEFLALIINDVKSLFLETSLLFEENKHSIG